MLNNLRGALRPALERMGRGFATINPSPDLWTGVGLALAFLAAAAYGLGPHLGNEESIHYGVLRHVAGMGVVAGGVLLLASGFFDMVDGQVARIRGRASQRGSYLDSVSDKVAESAIFVGIAIGGYAEPWLVVLAAALSLLVGYARAKSDSLGVRMQGVGIGERAERMLVIALVGVAGYMEAALAIVAVISAVTLVQRVRATSAQI